MYEGCTANRRWPDFFYFIFLTKLRNLNPSHVWKIYISTPVTSQPKRPLKLTFLNRDLTSALETESLICHLPGQSSYITVCCRWCHFLDSAPAKLEILQLLKTSRVQLQCSAHLDILCTQSQTSKFKVNASEAKLIISWQFLDDIFFHRVTFHECKYMDFFFFNQEVKK